MVFGIAGDRFGAKAVVAIGLLAQAVFALTYAFVGTLPNFYIVAALFGFTYAGVMPLYSVLARENFPITMMGSIIGGISMAGGLGMASGPLAGGLIYDPFASYFWLYAGARAWASVLPFGHGLPPPCQAGYTGTGDSLGLGDFGDQHIGTERPRHFNAATAMIDQFRKRRL